MPEVIFKPATLNQLWKNIPNLPSRRAYLAGGTDLVTVENSGFPSAECWIDIGDIPQLCKIKTTKDCIFIGAAVKINDLEESKPIKKYCPALIASIDNFASHSLRNTATLGGNAGNASPCADGVCALIAHDAEIVLLHGKEFRRMPLKDFFVGPKRSKLERDELIYGFEIKKHKGLKGAYLKLGPRAYFGISKVAVAVAAEIENGIVKYIRISAASVGPVIIEAKNTMEFLTGKEINAENLKIASDMIQKEVSPITDARSEADYRREMCGVLLERAINSLK